MNNLDYVNETVLWWLDHVCPDATWIISGQLENPPIPQKTTIFGFFNVVSINPKSMGETVRTFSKEKDKIRKTIKTYYDMLVSIEVNTKGFGAMNVVSKLIASLSDDTVKSYFKNKNLGFLNVQSVRNFSEVISGQVRRRFVLDFNLQAIDFYSTEVDRIDKAKLNYNM